MHILSNMEEMSRLQAAEAKALQQVAQVRLQLDLLEAQAGKGQSRALEDRVADLEERNASLEAALTAAEGKANGEAAAHVMILQGALVGTRSICFLGLIPSVSRR